MLDSGKKKALIEWVNSLCVSECIESLQQLSDGIHFCKLVQLIDRDQVCDFDNVEGRYKVVTDLLQSQYHDDLNGKLDFPLIKKADEFEISKVVLLLLCVGVLSENNVLFVEPAMKLDISTQLEIRAMAESVLQPDNRQQSLDSSYYRILLRPLEPMSTLSQPQMSSTPQASAPTAMDHSSVSNTFKTPTQSSVPISCFKGVPHTPVFSNSMQAGSSILGRFYSPQVAPVSPMSPVQQLISSPGISSKIKIQQKEQRIKRLLKDLNAERHLRTELEGDVKAHEENRDKLEHQISEMKKQLQSLRRQHQILVESGESANADLQAAASDSSRKRNQNLMKELRDSKDRNQFLESQNNLLSTDNNRLQEQLTKLDSFRQDCGKYKSTLDHFENMVSDLNAALREKAQLVKTVTEANHGLQDDLKRSQEMYREQIAELRRAMETSVTSEGGECLQEAMEKQLTGQMELLQQTLERTEKESSRWQSEFLSLQQSAELRVAELQKEVEASRTEATMSKEVLASERAQWSQTHQGLVSEVSMIQTARTQLNAQMEELQQQAQSTIDGLRKQLMETEQMAAQQTQQFVDNREKLEKQLQESAESCQSTEVKLRNLQQVMKATTESKQQCELQLLETKQHAAQLEENLKQASSTNQDLVARSENLSSELSDLKQNAECREVELSKLLKESEEQCIMIKNSAEEKSQIDNNEKERLIAAEVKLQSDYADLQTRKESLNQLVVELQASISSKEDDYEALCEENKNLENCLEMQMTEKNTLLNEKASLQRILEETKETYDGKLAELKKCTENELLDVKKNSELQIGKLKNDLEQKETERLHVSGCLEEIKTQKSHAEAKIMALNEELTVIKQSCAMEENCMKKALTDAEQQKCRLQELLSQTSEESRAQQARYEQHVAEATRKQSAIQQELADVQKQLEATAGEKGILLKRVEEEEAEKTEWQSKSMELQQELMTHKHQSQMSIKNIQEKLQMESTNNQILQQDVENFKSNMEQVEQHLITSKAAFDQELAHAREKNTKVQSQADNFKDNIEVLEKKMKACIENAKEDESKRSSLEQTLSENSKKLQMFSSNQDKYFEKVVLMEDALKASKEQSTLQEQNFEAQLEAKQKQLMDAQSELSRIKSELSEQKQSRKKFQNELSLVEDTLREKDLMATRLQETLNQTHCDITRQQEQYTCELEASRCREVDLQGQLSQAEKDLSEFKSHLQTLQQTLEQMNADLKLSHSQLSEVRTSLAGSQEHNQQLEEKLSMARKEVQSLEGSLSTNQSKATKLEEDFRVQKCTLEETLTQVRTRLAEANNTKQTLDGEIIHLSEQLEYEKRRVEETEAKLLITQETLKDIQRSSGLEQNDLKQEVVLLQDTKQQLLCNIESITTENKNTGSRLEAVSKQYEALQNQLVVQAEECGELKTQLQVAHTRNSEIDERVIVAENEKNELATRLTVIEESRQNVEAECSNQSQQVTFLEKEMEQIRNQLSEKSKELISSLEVIKVLQMKVQETETQSVNFERTLMLAKETAQLAHEELKGEVKNLEVQLHQAEANGLEQKALLEEAAANAAALEKSWKEATASKESVTADLATAEGRVQQLEEQVKDLWAKVVSIENVKQEVQSDNYRRENVLQRNIEDLIEINNQNKHEVQIYKSRVELLEKKMSEAVEEVNSLQNEHSAALARTDSLVSELCKEKESHGLTRSHLQNELSEARISRQESENRLQQMEGYSNKAVQQLEYQVSSLSRDKEVLTGKLHVTEEQLGVSRSTKESLREARDEVERLTGTNAHLVKEVKSLQNHLQQEVGAHLTKINAMEHVHDNQVVQMENAYQVLQDKCDSLDEQKRDLKCRVEQLEDEYKRVVYDLSQENRKLNQEVDQKVDAVAHQKSHLLQEHAAHVEDLLAQHKARIQDDNAEWNQKYESLTASYHKVKELLRQRESDCSRLQSSCESFRDRCNSKSNQLISQEQELEASREHLVRAENKYRETDAEVASLKTLLREHENTQKKLNAQIRTLQAQLDLASRHIKDSTTEGSRRKSVTTRNARARRETTFDVDVKSVLNESLEHEASLLSMNDLHPPRSPHNTRSRRNSRPGTSPESRLKATSSALGPTKRAPSTFSLASSTDTAFDHSPPRSWTSLTTRSSSALDTSISHGPALTRSRASVIGLPGVGLNPGRHNAVPRDIGRMFVGMAEDEPEMFEFGRLSELQRRNTLCLPHLKSAYPVEVQMRKPQEISDNALRESMRGGDSPSDNTRLRRKRSSSDGLPMDDSLDSSAKKRATGLLSDDSFDSEHRQRRASRVSSRSLNTDNDSLDGGSAKRKPSSIFSLSTPGVKLYKHFSPNGTRLSSTSSLRQQPLGSYQKPGPPTPGVTPGVTRVTPRRGRSTKHSPSPVVSTKKQRRSNRFTPLRRKTSNTENLMAQGNLPHEPTSFSIGFTPKKSKRLGRILGRKAQPQESQKKRPLADNNTLRRA